MKESKGLGRVKERKWKKKVGGGQERKGYINSQGTGR